MTVSACRWCTDKKYSWRGNICTHELSTCVHKKNSWADGEQNHQWDDHASSHPLLSWYSSESRIPWFKTWARSYTWRAVVTLVSPQILGKPSYYIILYYHHQCRTNLEGQGFLKNKSQKVKGNESKHYEFRWITLWSSSFTFHVICRFNIGVKCRMVSHVCVRLKRWVRNTWSPAQTMDGVCRFFLNHKTWHTVVVVFFVSYGLLLSGSRPSSKTQSKHPDNWYKLCSHPSA